ncbi:MAG: Mth938-like domain-containing protein [Pseudomonadota bacterium]
MKIHLEDTGGRYLIRAYGPGHVTVNQTVCTRSLIISPERLIADWAPQTLHELVAQHVADLMALSPEVVLLGTGRTLRFPGPEVMEALARAGIGHEFMDTGAACRTYNILTGEGRRVVAGLLIEPGGDQTS